MSSSYINIHTHHAEQCGENAYCILNLFPAQWPENTTEGRFSVGLHPWYIESRETARDELRVLEKALSHQQFLAVGEAGLDKITETDWTLQEEIFSAQVKISEAHNKPMIIHCVKAYSELLAMRKELKAQQVWIFHGFNSSIEMARQIISHGCMLSFGKLLMKEGSKAETIIRKIEARHWFLETDDEDISIESVYENAAKTTGRQIEELKSTMQENFKRVFRISLPE